MNEIPDPCHRARLCTPACQIDFSTVPLVQVRVRQVCALHIYARSIHSFCCTTRTGEQTHVLEQAYWQMNYNH